MYKRQLDGTARFTKIEDKIEIELYDYITYDELYKNIKYDGFSLPNLDEWEYLCGGGCRTLFPWGDDIDYNMNLAYYTKKGNKYDLEEPNFFGLSIACLLYTSIKTLYGLSAVRLSKSLDMIIELQAVDNSDYMSAPSTHLYEDVLGKPIKKRILEISSGRNAAAMVEVMVMDHMLSLIHIYHLLNQLKLFQTLQIDFF